MNEERAMAWANIQSNAFGRVVILTVVFKVLYRLKVPEKGDTLEFVEALSCPFPGQGIAYDPVTKGLVGIHRPEKKILFAIKEK